MKTIIAAGHVSLDITPVFPNSEYGSLASLLAPGRLLRVETADVHTGGSVSNTGLALKMLGQDVRLLGKVGNDAFGTMLRDLFADAGAGSLIVDPDGSTSYTVVLAVPGYDRIFLHSPGANDTFTSSDVPDEVLQDAVWLHFGYPPLMKKMYEHDGEELLSLFRRARSHGLVTSLDLAAVDPASEAGRVDWRSLLERVLPYVDFFLPSFEELCFMLDRERYTRRQSSGDITEGLDLAAEAAPLAQQALSMGARAVVIKCGVSGLYYQTAERSVWEHCHAALSLDVDRWADQKGIQPAFLPDIVRSGAGAGDVCIAAYLSAVTEGRDPAECAALAAAEGACCVTSYDTLSGLKPLSQLADRIRAGWKTVGSSSHSDCL